MRAGIDIVAISRFEKWIKYLNIDNLESNLLKSNFLNKNFSYKELSYASTRKNPAESLAGIFAAKEAFLKALQVGVLTNINLNEIEITHNKWGAPQIQISNIIKLNYNIINVHISISHDVKVDSAVAICVIE